MVPGAAVGADDDFRGEIRAELATPEFERSGGGEFVVVVMRVEEEGLHWVWRNERLPDATEEVVKARMMECWCINVGGQAPRAAAEAYGVRATCRRFQWAAEPHGSAIQAQRDARATRFRVPFWSDFPTTTLEGASAVSVQTCGGSAGA